MTNNADGHVSGGWWPGQGSASRVAAKVEWYPDELFTRVGFIVTDMGGGAASVVSFYNLRGTAEQWIKEGRPYADPKKRARKAILARMGGVGSALKT